MKNKNVIKIVAAIGFIAMVFVNYLANALPIGGITTAEASDAYPNLFTPAGITFSIWGLIYLLLLGYTIYQFKTPKDKQQALSFSKIRKIFILTSLANIGWIFSWHYQILWLSVLFMLTLLISLMNIVSTMSNQKYSLKDNLLVYIPFSIYLGWITIATIANITVFLVSIQWDGFGISENIWTITVLLAGVIVGIIRMLQYRNIYYGLVLVWGYTGIWIKHTSPDGFANAYPEIITTLVMGLVLYLTAIGYIGIKKIDNPQVTACPIHKNS